MAVQTTPADLSSFADLVDESIQDIFIKRGEQPTKMEQYFNVESTSSYYDKDSSVSGTERAKFISENASVIFDAPLQGYNQTYTQKKYGDGMKITDQLWKFGVEFRRITSLAESLMDSI